MEDETPLHITFDRIHPECGRGRPGEPCVAASNPIFDSPEIQKLGFRQCAACRTARDRILDRN